MCESGRAALARMVCVIVLVGTAVSAGAAPLAGSGTNLPIPAPNAGDPPRQGAALSGITAAGFDGTWTAPALAPWVGTFSASGPVPSSNLYPAGFTRYNFTSLPTGVLPAGTYFSFGDVDGGSVTVEQFILSAYTASGALITTPWLDEAIGVVGTGTGLGGSIVAGNLPGWSWDGILGQYTVDGTTVTGGNPSVGIFFPSNTGMAFLDVERTSNFANFGLSAPIPEPGTIGLLAAACGIAFLRRRSA